MTLSGHIDRVTHAGFFEGWARQTGRATALPVAILWEEKIVARGIADRFRKDLPAAGMDHGHYEFRLRLLQPIPPGPAAFQLLEAETLEPIIPTPLTLTVPRIAQRRLATVEDLLSEGPRWSDQDIVEAVDSLHLEANFRRMGAKRFIDAVFHFGLGRAADPSAIAGYAPALLSGRVSPVQVFMDVLGSEERRNRGGSLPSPYQDSYPFKEHVYGDSALHRDDVN